MFRYFISIKELTLQFMGANPCYHNSPCLQSSASRHGTRAISCFSWQHGERSVSAELSDANLEACYRYVDEYLISLDTKLKPPVTPERLVNIFKHAFDRLEFTREVPENPCIQFLNLHIKIDIKRTCWIYKSRKGLLRNDPAHSKIVKRGTAASCLTEATRKNMLLLRRRKLRSTNV